MKRLYDSEMLDLNTFRFDKDMRDDLKLDSLNIVVLITEIENEFTTVFEDRVFESVRKLSELVDILVRDEKIFWCLHLIIKLKTLITLSIHSYINKAKLKQYQIDWGTYFLQIGHVFDTLSQLKIQF